MFAITRLVVEVHGGLHRQLGHTILMFNPNNLDDVCVQATHLEERGKNTLEEGSKKSFKGKQKENGFNGKKNASIKEEEEKNICKHCSKEDHDEANFWKLHPEMKPKKLKNKGKGKTTTIIQEDFGSDLGDETKITTMGTRGK